MKKKGKLKAAFHEIRVNPPKVLSKTRAKKGSAMVNKQRIAIGLSKARAAGAKIPKPRKAFKFYT